MWTLGLLIANIVAAFLLSSSGISPLSLLTGVLFMGSSVLLWVDKMTDSTEHEDKMRSDVGYRMEYNKAKKIEELEAKVAKFERKGKYNSEGAIRVRYMLERTKKGCLTPQFQQRQ
ncbi:hypothetical protein F4X10_20910 [Candidatus Poribacteria bacterium]|nr:hypothetical protein [Candidatus Poribacteria bacterium]